MVFEESMAYLFVTDFAVVVRTANGGGESLALSECAC